MQALVSIELTLRSRLCQHSAAGKPISRYTINHETAPIRYLAKMWRAQPQSYHILRRNMCRGRVLVRLLQFGDNHAA